MFISNGLHLIYLYTLQFLYLIILCISMLQIVDKLFRRIDEENLGYITSFQIMEFLSNISDTR